MIAFKLANVFPEQYLLFIHKLDYIILYIYQTLNL